VTHEAEDWGHWDCEVCKEARQLAREALEREPQLLAALRHALGEGDGFHCPHMKHYGTDEFAGAEECSAFKVLRSADTQSVERE
jgi:hypothetical protein